MNKSEYESTLKAIDEECKNKKIELLKNAAMSNNNYKTGDIIKEDRTDMSIVLESIKYTWGYGGTPQIIYIGTILKKDGTKRKDEKKASIYMPVW